MDLLTCAYGDDEDLLRTKTFDLVGHLVTGDAPERDAEGDEVTTLDPSPSSPSDRAPCLHRALWRPAKQ